MKPIIGITPDTHSGRKLKGRTPTEKITYLWDGYLQSILDHGGIPVILPVTENQGQIREMAKYLHGLVLAGGNFDVPPELYGATAAPWLGPVKAARSRFELALFRLARRRSLPVLGICGGMQTINVAYGGTLLQDISQEQPRAAEHQQSNPKDRTSHSIKIEPGTQLHRLFGGRRQTTSIVAKVNSTHHQALKTVGRGLTVNAVAKDGIIEGIEDSARRYVLGVQWHPELLYRRITKHSKLFAELIRVAKQTG